jgi:hypothetical protein
MSRLLFLAVFVAAGAASAQTTGGLGPSSDGPAPGACTPTGVTASGEIVFPFTCKAFLERLRGPIEDPKLGAILPKPAPAAKVEKPAITNPGVRPVETTGSTSSVDQQKQIEARKKRVQARQQQEQQQKDAQEKPAPPGGLN